MISWLRRLLGITTIIDNQGLIMSKLDTIIADINDETNALAAKLDALEVAVGGTFTQANLDALAGISARLKGLAAPVAAPVDGPPAAVVTVPSATDPAPKSSSVA